MLRAFSTSATGMSAQQMIVDTIANNLANINTVGFKRSQMDFQDLMYLRLSEAGRETASGVTAPTGLDIGSGVRPNSSLKVYTQGEMENTGRNLDLAIEGDGFFQVSAGGQTRFTRDGALRTNADGQLVTANGYTLEPAITIPNNARSVSVGRDGTVSVFTGSSNTATVVGTISVVRFANPSGLSNEGGNLLSETPASGSAIVGTAGSDGVGAIQQGFLERSNVQMVTELVSLITAQRAYEINSRAIKAGDDMLRTANGLIS
ncbi:MAG: flagellar basal-body rod protein FlgG [Planctomycetaceae bacterium]|nr:flagellar basal-body rod protein FlgG [Planctomycetaceae bacterium]